jgi:hypothetical protein
MRHLAKAAIIISGAVGIVSSVVGLSFNAVNVLVFIVGRMFENKGLAVAFCVMSALSLCRLLRAHVRVERRTVAAAAALGVSAHRRSCL